jgi:hypothetical protein
MLLAFDFCNLAPGLHRPLWATTGRPRFPHRTNPVLRVRGRPPALFLASSPNSAKRADALETQPRSKNESQKSVSYSITSSPVASSASGIRTPTGDLSDRQLVPIGVCRPYRRFARLDGRPAKTSID